MRVAEGSLGRLVSWFRDRGGRGAVVAFSGGVDSTLVAAAARRALGDSAEAVTVRTDFMTGGEVAEAVSTAKELGIRHRVLRLRLPVTVRSNPPDRCYRCKRLIMRELKKHAKGQGKMLVVDGTNSDDLGSARPGLRAIREEGIASPLAELGLGKCEVREMSKALGLRHDKPSSPCLATRFPTGHRVTLREAERVAEAEDYVRGLGFAQVRVRVRGNLAKVEVGKDELVRMMDGGRHRLVAKELRGLGFEEVTLDLEGYVPEVSGDGSPRKGG